MAAVSSINKAAYALEKSSLALLCASTPRGRECAQSEFDAACDDMRALLAPVATKIKEAA